MNIKLLIRRAFQVALAGAFFGGTQACFADEAPSIKPVTAFKMFGGKTWIVDSMHVDTHVYPIPGGAKITMSADPVTGEVLGQGPVNNYWCHWVLDGKGGLKMGASGVGSTRRFGAPALVTFENRYCDYLRLAQTLRMEGDRLLLANPERKIKVYFRIPSANVIEGEITYTGKFEGRYPMPKAGVIHFEVLRLAGSESSVALSSKLEGVATFPHPYSVEFDPSSFPSGSRYVIFLKVVAGGETHYVSKEQVSVFHEGTKPVSGLNLELVKADDDATPES